jgi:hypothetical protein
MNLKILLGLPRFRQCLARGNKKQGCHFFGKPVLMHFSQSGKNVSWKFLPGLAVFALAILAGFNCGAGSVTITGDVVYKSGEVYAPVAQATVSAEYDRTMDDGETKTITKSVNTGSNGSFELFLITDPSEADEPAEVGDDETIEFRIKIKREGFFTSSKTEGAKPGSTIERRYFLAEK